MQPTPRSVRLVYSPQYNIGFAGLEKFHPFDGRKYGRAWKVLRRHFGRPLHRLLVKPPGPITYKHLSQFHDPAYLRKLRDRTFLAKLLEIPPLRRVPAWLIERLILRHMRWATMGTIVAAREALTHGIAVNLSGGYHHASPANGHGFCAFADVGLAIAGLRTSGRLSQDDKVIYVDLDAHQGNGVCRTFVDDPRVLIYDQYNRNTFPLDSEARRRIDCDVAVPKRCHPADYLSPLEDRLPPFLNSVTATGRVGIAIYNAGTDVYIEDQLGGLSLSATQVLQRDRFVLNELINRNIPTLILLSGGYSRESYQLVANMVEHIIETWGGLTPRN